MILSKIRPGEHTLVNDFFLKRVFPITLIFCAVLYFTNGFFAAMTLLICIPIEIYTIITILELNISKKYYNALALSLLGYPLVFIVFILMCFISNADISYVYILFLLAAILKSSMAYFLRRTSQYRNDVLVTSAQVPLQQAGNYLLFRSDQLIIASGIMRFSIFNFMIPGDYLFYSKMTEMFSGISTSMSPVLSRFKKDNSEEISVMPLLKNKFFILLNLIAIITQTIVYLMFVKETDDLHILMCIPFALITLMIIPVNMINYELYRTSSLKVSNTFNLISMILGMFLLSANIIFKSPLIFAFTIPIQLFTFIALNQFRKKQHNV